MSLHDERGPTLFEALALMLIAAAITLLGVMLVVHRAGAHEYAASPQVQQWFETLMRPDNVLVACCGEADAYQADDFKVVAGHVVATITDGRDDKLPDGRKRVHIPPGTEVIIPDEKIKWDKGNPTGHGYIFIGRGLSVLCYIAPGGA